MSHICRYLDVDGAKLLANALHTCCPVTLITAIQFCLVLHAFTSPNSACSELTGLFFDKSPPCTCSTCSTAAFSSLAAHKIWEKKTKICLLTYKTLHTKQPVCFHFMLATSLLSCSLISNEGITLSVPRIKTNVGARAFCSCTSSLWNTLQLLVHSTTSITTFRSISRRISRVWPHDFQWQ